MKENVGNLDSNIRFILGIFLIWLGLFHLNGIEGDLKGILIALISIAPFTVSFTRKCPVFHLLKISSLSNKNKSSDQ